MIHVTVYYATAIACLMAVLATRAGLSRGRHRVALGDGENRAVALAIRRFGNLSEYAAMAVLILLLMELQGIGEKWLHLYGVTLVVLRIIHPIALYDNTSVPSWRRIARFVSAFGTVFLLVAGAVAIVLA